MYHNNIVLKISHNTDLCFKFDIFPNELTINLFIYLFSITYGHIIHSDIVISKHIHIINKGVIKCIFLFDDAIPFCISFTLRVFQTMHMKQAYTTFHKLLT
jgi:hypothetical protein